MFLLDSFGLIGKDQPRKQRKLLFHGRCAYCQHEFDHLTLDHFIPKLQGGRENIENLIPACVECNGDKGCEFPDDWYQRQSFFDSHQWQRILLYVGTSELNRLIKNQEERVQEVPSLEP